MNNEIVSKEQETRDFVELQKEKISRFIKGNMLPKGCTPDEAFARIIAGADLGLKPFQAINGIAILNGKPTLHSDSIPAIVMATGMVEDMGHKFEGQDEDLSCTFYCKRKGIEQVQEWTYSVKEARQAGLLNNIVWKNHTRKMLFNRARTYCFRNTFPDVLGNLYSYEEASEINTNIQTVEKPDNIEELKERFKEAKEGSEELVLEAETEKV